MPDFSQFVHLDLCRPAKITGAHTTANIPAVIIKKAGTKDQCEGSATVYNSCFFFVLFNNNVTTVCLQVDVPIINRAGAGL